METAWLVTSAILSSPKDKCSVVIRHWRQAYHAACWGRKGIKRNRTEKQRKATKYPSLLLLLIIQTLTSLQMSGTPVLHSYISTRLFCVYLTQLKHSIFSGFCSVFMSFERWAFTMGGSSYIPIVQDTTPHDQFRKRTWSWQTFNRTLDAQPL